MYTRLKVILVISLITTLIMVLSSTSMAVENPSDYNPGGVSSGEVSRITDVTGTILATIQNIGMISAAVILTIIGLRYMFGSLEEKANYKENMIPYIIGCFLLVAAATIPNMVYEIANRRTGIHEIMEAAGETVRDTAESVGGST